MALLSSLEGLGFLYQPISPALKRWAIFKRRRRQADTILPTSMPWA